MNKGHIGRIRAPMIEIDLIRAHAIWLFCKADWYYTNIGKELPGVSVQAIRKMIARTAWRREPDWQRRGEYDKRAIQAAVLIREGRGNELLPIPADEIAQMGRNFFEETEFREVMDSNGNYVAPEMIVNDGLPNPLNTIQQATNGGAGPDKLISEIASLLSAESLAVPNKIGFSLCPIPEGLEKISMNDELGEDGLGNPYDVTKYVGGVVLMGRPWDKSYIVPDRDSRSKGIRLAKEVFGITDKEQLDLIVKKHRLVREEIEGEFKDKERKRKIEEMMRQEDELRGLKKEVAVAGTVIEFHRPKQLTPAQWNERQKKEEGK